MALSASGVQLAPDRCSQRSAGGGHLIGTYQIPSYLLARSKEKLKLCLIFKGLSLRHQKADDNEIDFPQCGIPHAPEFWAKSFYSLDSQSSKI